MHNIGNADLKLLKEIYQDNLDYALNKLKDNYPIQYLIGYVDFYNTKINVNESVLIPRFETELLVEKAINFLKTKNYQTILDIATGSGCISIALKKNLNITIDACDISNKALKVAKTNALNNNVTINYFKMDILTNIPKHKYDCIISNPPYVIKNEIVSPQTKYEPSIALYANHNGLEFYERILSIAPTILNKNGSLIFEIGSTQKEAIKKIALSYFPQAKITTLKDYNNYDRFMLLKHKSFLFNKIHYKIS